MFLVRPAEIHPAEAARPGEGRMCFRRKASEYASRDSPGISGAVSYGERPHAARRFLVPSFQLRASTAGKILCKQFKALPSTENNTMPAGIRRPQPFIRQTARVAARFSGALGILRAVCTAALCAHGGITQVYAMALSLLKTFRFTYAGGHATRRFRFLVTFSGGTPWPVSYHSAAPCSCVFWNVPQPPLR